jgi:transposase
LRLTSNVPAKRRWKNSGKHELQKNVRRGRPRTLTRASIVMIMMKRMKMMMTKNMAPKMRMCQVKPRCPNRNKEKIRGAKVTASR